MLKAVFTGPLHFVFTKFKRNPVLSTIFFSKRSAPVPKRKATLRSAPLLFQMSIKLISKAFVASAAFTVLSYWAVALAE